MPITRAQRRAYVQKMNTLMKRAQSMTKTEIRSIITLLEDTRKEVASIIIKTDWHKWYIQQLNQDITRIINDLRAKYINVLDEADKKMWNLGVDFVDEPLQIIGMMLPITDIDMTGLSILQGFSEDLITGLTDEARKKIHTEITLGLLGGKTPHEAMKAIGLNLKDKSVFSSIASRAEMIARTEMNRALSMAAQARLEQAAKNVPGLEKEWRHAPYVRNPRQQHIAMNGQHVLVNKKFTAPDGTKLLKPRDPNAPAKHTIGCNCYMLPYHKDFLT